MPARDSFIPLKHPLSLRYFHEVARAGSFRKASDQIHVAASAINRHVKYLEEEMGTLLFERGKGRAGLKLTAAGEVLQYRLKRAMAELGAARTEVNALLGLDQGTVNMGVNEAIWRELLPGVLASFRKAHPGVTHRAIVGSSPRLIEQLLADEIDLALAFNPRPHPDVTFAVRHHAQTCILVRRNHPLAKRRTVRLSDCAGYDLVMPDESLALRATLDTVFAQADVTPRTVLTTNSYEVMLSAAESGLGIAILSQQLFRTKTAKSSMVFIPLRDAGIPAQVVACCVRKGRPLSTASHAMVGAIEKALAEAR